MTRTETGKLVAYDSRYHGGMCPVGTRRSDWCACGHIENVRYIEAEAAAMERERLRKKTVDTDNDHAAWCENPAGEAATGMLCHRCKGILRYLLADPTP